MHAEDYRRIYNGGRLAKGSHILTSSHPYVLTFTVFLAWSQTAPRKQLDVRYVPTPPQVVDAMLSLAKVTAADVVYDLGSGDGRIPIEAARKYGARGVGIELDSNRIKDSNDNLAKAGVADRVQFFNRDLFEAYIGDATVVTLFLLPQLNQRLIPKLKRELRPGTRVVSYLWDMGDEWPPDRVGEVDGLKIFLWIVR